MILVLGLLRALLQALPLLGAKRKAQRTPAAAAMVKRAPVATMTPANSSAWRRKSHSATHLHRLRPVLHHLDQQVIVRKPALRTLVVLAVARRARVATLTQASTSVWRQRSQPAVVQLQEHPGASMMLQRTHARLAMALRAHAATLIHPSISAWPLWSQHAAAPLQLPVAAVIAPKTAQQMPVAGAPPCRSPNVATASLACGSAGGCRISAAIQTQLLLSLSKMVRSRSMHVESRCRVYHPHQTKF